MALLPFWKFVKKVMIELLCYNPTFLSCTIFFSPFQPCGLTWASLVLLIFEWRDLCSFTYKVLFVLDSKVQPGQFSPFLPSESCSFSLSILFVFSVKPIHPCHSQRKSYIFSSATSSSVFVLWFSATISKPSRSTHLTTFMQTFHFPLTATLLWQKLK